jgi:FkbM family methyltransferase
VKERLNLSEMNRYREKWPWEKFKGSVTQLKWSFRDLRNLDVAIQQCRHRRVAVQAGGNLGLFPKRLAEDFFQVITFEPDPALFDMMQHNAPESNIVSVQAALGNSTDGVSMRTCRRYSKEKPVHEGLTHVAGPGKIPQMRLDLMDLPDCDLIYLDIEGFEFNALRGAEKTIERCRPVIGVEINRNIQYYGSTAEEIRCWLYARRYERIYVCNSDEIFVPC